MDVLLYLWPGQARTGVADFYIALYADDGTAAHAPGQQIGSPWSLSNAVGALNTSRATWLQVDVSGAGWPALSQAAYYWVGLLPGTPLALPNGLYNGVAWSGLSTLTVSTYPGSADPALLFTARELASQRFSGDAAFGAGTAAAVSFEMGASGWATVPNASPRYTNWAASGSRVRYGLQALGFWGAPVSSATGEEGGGLPLCMSAARRPLLACLPALHPMRSVLVGDDV